MNEIRNLILPSAISFVALTSFYFLVGQGNTWLPPLSGVVFALAGFLYLYASRLVRSTHKNLSSFSNFFLAAGVAALLHPISHLVVPIFSSSHTVINAIDSLTHIPLFIAAMLIFNITTTLLGFSNQIRKAGLAFLAGLSLASIVLHALTEHSPLSGILILLLTFIAYVLPGIYFLSFAVKSTEHIVRRKATLIGIGLIPFIAIGPMSHILTQSNTVSLATYFIFILTITLIASGILYRPEISLGSRRGGE